MSLTTDIAAVVSRANALIDKFDAKEAAINAAIAAALLTIPQATRVVYLDAINGNDANEGTLAAPIQTFTRAIALGGPNRGVDIALLTDVTLNAARTFIPFNQAIRVYSYGYIYADPTNSPMKKVRLTVQPKDSATLTGDWQVSSFYCPLWGVNAINFQTVEIVFPAAPGAGVMVPDVYNGLISANTNAGPAMVGLELTDCKLTRPAGSVGVLCGIRTHFISLMVKNSTYVTAEMAGKWIANVASGAAPSSLGWAASNLTSL